jgi:hypothetical protein
MGDAYDGLNAGIPRGRQERNQERRQPQTKACPCNAQTRGFTRYGPQKKRNNQQAGWDDELEQYFQQVHPNAQAPSVSKKRLRE